MAVLRSCIQLGGIGSSQYATPAFTAKGHACACTDTVILETPSQPAFRRRWACQLRLLVACHLTGCVGQSNKLNLRLKPKMSIGLVEALKDPSALVVGPLECTSDSPTLRRLLGHAPWRRLWPTHWLPSSSTFHRPSLSSLWRPRDCRHLCC